MFPLDLCYIDTDISNRRMNVYQTGNQPRCPQIEYLPLLHNKLSISSRRTSRYPPETELYKLWLANKADCLRQGLSDLAHFVRLLRYTSELYIPPIWQIG